MTTARTATMVVLGSVLPASRQSQTEAPRAEGAIGMMLFDGRPAGDAGTVTP